LPFTLAAVVLVALKLCTAVALGGGAWAVVTVLRRMSGAERAGAALIFALALALRLAAPSSPHDLYNRSDGALWNPWPEFDRGLGFAAFGQIVQPWLAAWRTDDLWLYDRVAWAGAAVPLLVVAWLTSLEVSAWVVWPAGLLFALSSPHVRLSHTDAQQLPALTFLWIGLLAWSLHARAPRWLPALVAGAALACAGSARLECVTLPVVFAVAATAASGLPAWRHRASVAAALLCFVVVTVHTYGMVFAGTWNPFEYTNNPTTDWRQHNLMLYGYRQLVMLDPAYTAPPVAIASLLGMFTGPLPTRLRVGAALCAVGLSLSMPVWSPVGGAAFALSRYQVAATPFACVLAANGLAAVVGWLPWAWARAATVGVAVLASATRLPMAFEPSTLSAEYHFIRDTLPTLPPDCTVVYELWTNDQGLGFPSWLVFLLQLPLKTVPMPDWSGDTSTCTVYYRSASCLVGAHDGPMCSDYPSTHRLEPIAEAQLPQRQWVYDLYTVSPVPVGFYWIHKP
jgi:hypothetical protein